MNPAFRPSRRAPTRREGMLFTGRGDLSGPSALCRQRYIARLNKLGFGRVAPPLLRHCEEPRSGDEAISRSAACNVFLRQLVVKRDSGGSPLHNNLHKTLPTIKDAGQPLWLPSIFYAVHVIVGAPSPPERGGGGAETPARGRGAKPLRSKAWRRSRSTESPFLYSADPFREVGAQHMGLLRQTHARSEA